MEWTWPGWDWYHPDLRLLQLGILPAQDCAHVWLPNAFCPPTDSGALLCNQGWFHITLLDLSACGQKSKAQEITQDFLYCQRKYRGERANKRWDCWRSHLQDINTNITLIFIKSTLLHICRDKRLLWLPHYLHCPGGCKPRTCRLRK